MFSIKTKHQAQKNKTCSKIMRKETRITFCHDLFTQPCHQTTKPLLSSGTGNPGLLLNTALNKYFS